MTDFNLLGFLNVNVPNEPPAPIILEKQNYRILAPTKKFKDPSSANKGNGKLSLNQTSTPVNQKTQAETITKHNVYFRTTYGQSFGTASDSKTQEDEVPSTPASTASASSVSSTISTCDDPACDDCLNKQQQADKKALAEAERNSELLAYEKEKLRVQEEVNRERIAAEEKRRKEKQAYEDDLERVRGEKAAARAQRQKEDQDYAEMQRELSRVDNGTLRAAQQRNREYLSGLQDQLEGNRQRRAAELEESKIPYSSSIGIVDDDEARRRAQAEVGKDLSRTLEQQIADKRAEGVAERAAEIEELKRRQAEEDAEFRAKQAAEEEKQRLRKEDFIRSNRDAINEKKAHSKAEDEEEKAFARQQRDADARKAEEERRAAEEKRRAELEALHTHLVEQVQRRKDALERQKEEERAYVPTEAARKKQLLVHCEAGCDRDLPPERFSNYIVTPNGKVYRKSKAYLQGSPLRKYLYGQKQRTSTNAYDFGGN